MAAVTIDFVTLLMPADKAMKLVELMQHAVSAENDWVGRKDIYTVKSDNLNVSLKLLQPNDIRMPDGESMPIKAAPLRLR